jgi:hypothetical protein
MTVLRFFTCAAVALGTLWVAGLAVMWPVWAQPPVPVQPATVRDTGAVSKEQAVKMVEGKFRARVVRTETRHEGGHTFYVMRVLSDSGHVWTVRVDAASGSIQ